MKRKITAGIILMMTMSSCGGLYLSSEFGLDDYGPSNGYYWPGYGNVYNRPPGYYGPVWPSPPPPPVIVQPSKPPKPNGGNLPNYVPSQPSKPSMKPSTTAPDGQTRPGNMGQGPVNSGTGSSTGNSGSSSGTRRGR